MTKGTKSGILRRRLRMRVIPLALAAFFALSAAGCGKVVFVTGLDRDELFNVGDQSGSCRELRVYLTTMENRYKEDYGSDVFTRSGNETVGNSLKENALERLVKVKALNQIAWMKGILLDETEVSDARKRGAAYMDSLSDAEKDYLGISALDAEEMMKDYLLAAKVAEQLVSDVPREVSDDEARTVTVQSILVKTYTENADGSRTEFDESRKAEAKARAQAIRDEIQNGMDNLLGITFAAYISKYNEDSVSTYTIAKGDVDRAFEEAAFGQQVGTISDVVETKDGYRIIKPIAMSDEASLESNKKAILQKRLEEAYDQAYDSCVSGMDRQLNEDRWHQITLCEDPGVATDNFFDVAAGN